MEFEIEVNKEILTVSSAKEMLELNKGFTLSSLGERIFYGPPFNKTIIVKSNFGLCVNLPSMILVLGRATYSQTIQKGELEKNRLLYDSIALMFELDSLGVVNRNIKEILEPSYATAPSNVTPLPYAYNVNSAVYRKAALTLELLDLGLESLVDKYELLLTSKLTISMAKEYNTTRRRLNELLNS